MSTARSTDGRDSPYCSKLEMQLQHPRLCRANFEAAWHGREVPSSCLDGQRQQKVMLRELSRAGVAINIVAVPEVYGLGGRDRVRKEKCRKSNRQDGLGLAGESPEDVGNRTRTTSY